MKTLALLVVYILSFISIFFILSLVGILFTNDYLSIIRNENWAGAYCLFLGWWLAILPAREFYLQYKKQFDLIY